MVIHRRELELLADTIRTLRDASGLTQEKLAEHARVDRTFISQLERAQSNASFITIRRVLSALGVTWAEFGREIDRHSERTRR